MGAKIKRQGHHKPVGGLVLTTQITIVAKIWGIDSKSSWVFFLTAHPDQHCFDREFPTSLGASIAHQWASNSAGDAFSSI